MPTENKARTSQANWAQVCQYFLLIILTTFFILQCTYYMSGAGTSSEFSRRVVRSGMKSMVLTAAANAYLLTQTMNLKDVTRPAPTPPSLPTQSSRSPTPTSKPTAAMNTSLAPTTQSRKPVSPTKGKPAIKPSLCPDTLSMLQKLSSPSKKTVCQKNSESVPLKTELAFPITLVTAYYAIRSKRPASTYLKWMGNILHKIKTPIAFFTNCDSVKKQPSFVDQLHRREKLFPGLLYADIVELDETPLSQNFGPIMKRQEGRDRERGVGHNYLLYLVWLMKTEALMKTIRENRFCSEWFLWVDVGAFRNKNHPLVNWPSIERLKMLPKNRTLLELVYGFPNLGSVREIDPSTNLDDWLNSKRSLIYHDHIAGGFIGFNIRHNAHNVFYRTLTDTYKLLADRNFMIVKDQAVFHTLVLMHPKLVSFIQSSWACGDGWFFIEAWLADSKEWNCEYLTKLVTPG